MPRQIAGNHGKPLIQRPLDHVPIKSGVIIKAMKHKQRRLRPFGPPELADDFIAIDLKTPQSAAYIARRKIQPVKPLISLCL